jgi:hypothetical protein
MKKNSLIALISLGLISCAEGAGSSVDKTLVSPIEKSAIPQVFQCKESDLEKLCVEYCGDAVYQFDLPYQSQVRVLELLQDEDGIYYDMLPKKNGAESPRFGKDLVDGRNPLIYIKQTGDGFDVMQYSLSGDSIIASIPNVVEKIANLSWNPNTSTLIFDSTYINSSENHIFRFDYENPYFETPLLYPLCFATEGNNYSEAQLQPMEALGSLFTSLTYTKEVEGVTTIMSGSGTVDPSNPFISEDCTEELQFPGAIPARTPNWHDFLNLLSVESLENSSIFIYDGNEVSNITSAKDGGTYDQYAWANNSNWMAYVKTFQDHSTVGVVNAETGERRALSLNDDKILPYVGNPTWLPNDQAILITSGFSMDTQKNLHMVNFCEGKTIIINDKGNISDLDIGYITRENPDTPSLLR